MLQVVASLWKKKCSAFGIRRFSEETRLTLPPSLQATSARRPGLLRDRSIPRNIGSRSASVIDCSSCVWLLLYFSLLGLRDARKTFTHSLREPARNDEIDGFRPHSFSLYWSGPSVKVVCPQGSRLSVYFPIFSPAASSQVLSVYIHPTNQSQELEDEGDVVERRRLVLVEAGCS